MAKEMFIVEAIRETLRQEMRRNENMVLLGCDIGIENGFGGAFTVTLGLSEEFGHERVIDTPISELGFIGAAVGAAMVGLVPVADVQYSDFLYCAMDQIANQMAKMRYMSASQWKVPMVLRAPVGVTSRGAQHAQCPEGLFMGIPGLKIAVPSTAYDAMGLLRTALRGNDPVMYFEHKRLYGQKGRPDAGEFFVSSQIPDEDFTVPFGKAAVRREGSDVTIIGKLLMVHEALAAATELEKDGISCEVIDPRTLVPFDEETLLNSVAKTSRLLIVDEGTRAGGWSSEVAAIVVEKGLQYLDAPIKRLTAPDTPAPFAPNMREFYMPSKQKIIETVRELF